MCGILGVLCREGVVSQESIDAGLAAMHHRGPDGRGRWRSADGSVGLGHTRLQVMDLVGGAQPMSNEDGSCWAVVNGEFYDFVRLRRELEERGHRFQSCSDSEILLHLYEEHGTACLEHLRGEFAFVLWDTRRRRLFAARDRFGIKPLCYVEREGELWLASEAKALFAAGTPAVWDEEALAQAFALQYLPADRTLFAGVRQLPPGMMLVSEGTGCRLRRYWDLDFPVEADEPGVAQEEEVWVEGLRAHLEEAVILRLRADVPVCLQLSGGLDSSSVLALAAAQSTKPLDCFCVSFAAEGYDELAVAREMAAYAGAVLHPVQVSQADLVTFLPEAAVASEGLAINGHLSAKYLLHQAVHKAGYKVILTGEGADEALAGYVHLRQDLLQAEADTDKDAMAALAQTNQASAGLMLAQDPSATLASVVERLGYMPSFLRAKVAMGRRLQSVLSEAFCRRLLARDRGLDFVASFGDQSQLQDRHPILQSSYLWTKSALANYILKTLGDGTEMAHAIEGRVPFLDHVFFEFVRKVPREMKIRGQVEKVILREAMQPELTETIYRRQKHPFVAPPLSAFADVKTQTILRDHLASKAFQELPFFDQKAILALLDKLPKMPQTTRAMMDPLLFTAMSMAALQTQLQPSTT